MNFVQNSNDEIQKIIHVKEYWYGSKLHSVDLRKNL